MAYRKDDELSPPPGRLRTVAISCWRLFENIAICSPLQPRLENVDVQSDFLIYDYGRFRIWCGNLGARQEGHASLDWRLRDAETMEATVYQMLKDLEDDLQQSLEVLTGARYQQKRDPLEAVPDMDELPPAEEIKIRCEAIASTINSLYEISYFIRNQSTRRLAYAKAQRYQPRDPDEEALIQSFLPHDERHVEDFFKDLRRDKEYSRPVRFDRELNAMLEDNALKKQCVAAITARRRQLAYWKNHDRKLQSERDADQPEIAGTLFSGTQASGVFKQTTDDIVESQSIVSSIASTVRDIDGNEALFPGPPKRVSEYDAFVCSYCFVLCGPEEAKYSRWRKHIREDLQPYFCTFPGCPNGLRLYGNHHDWANHEKTSHGEAFADRTKCPICLLPGAELPRPQTFAKHLASHMERLSVDCLPLDADFGEGEHGQEDKSNSSDAESGLADMPEGDSQGSPSDDLRGDESLVSRVMDDTMISSSDRKPSESEGGDNELQNPQRDDTRHGVLSPRLRTSAFKAWYRDRETGERWVGNIGDPTPFDRPDRSMRETSIPEEEVIPQSVSAEHELKYHEQSDSEEHQRPSDIIDSTSGRKE